MADQQSPSDIEHLGGGEFDSQTNGPTTATSNDAEDSVTIREDPSPCIDQISEFRQLADERGIRIEELEKEVDDKANQIALLNAKLGTECHTESAVVDRKGKEKKQLREKIEQLEDDVRKVEKERDQLRSRLDSTRKYGVGVLLLLSLMVVAMFLFQLPCKACPVNKPCRKCPGPAPCPKYPFWKYCPDIEPYRKQIQKLMISLSDCMTSNNNDGVVETDLEAGKLAQEYQGIYAQDYTMAIDELDEQDVTMDVRETVRMFLDILKVAHELAEEYTMKHLVSMNQSVTSLLIKQLDTDSQDKKKHVWVNSTLSKMELNDFYNLRQSSAWRMRESITEELGGLVAERFRIDTESQPLMMAYVENCVSLCWKANMHRNPVYIDFREPGVGIEFDYNVYRPFLHQTGSYVDYVVWPPMFEKRGGRLIAKGIAEKRD